LENEIEVGTEPTEYGDPLVWVSEPSELLIVNSDSTGDTSLPTNRNLPPGSAARKLGEVAEPKGEPATAVSAPVEPMANPEMLLELRLAEYRYLPEGSTARDTGLVPAR
jgi:hypothetical protein